MLLPDNANLYLLLFIADALNLNTTNKAPDAVVEDVDKKGWDHCWLRRWQIGNVPINAALLDKTQGNAKGLLQM